MIKFKDVMHDETDDGFTPDKSKKNVWISQEMSDGQIVKVYLSKQDIEQILKTLEEK